MQKELNSTFFFLLNKKKLLTFFKGFQSNGRKSLERVRYGGGKVETYFFTVNLSGSDLILIPFYIMDMDSVCKSVRFHVSCIPYTYKYKRSTKTDSLEWM